MIICIGREFGSGGHKIGFRLAEELHIKFYDQELVDKVFAQNSHGDEARLRRADEKKPNAMLYRANYDSEDPNLRGISDHDLMFELQSRIIRDLAAEGDCVFIGRCADYVLKEADIPRCSIFITAPFEDRIRRITTLYQLSEKDAVARIRKEDKARKSYYNYHTGGSWGKPSNYDICINSSFLGIEQTVDALVRVGSLSERRF